MLAQAAIVAVPSGGKAAIACLRHCQVLRAVVRQAEGQAGRQAGGQAGQRVAGHAGVGCGQGVGARRGRTAPASRPLFMVASKQGQLVSIRC